MTRVIVRRLTARADLVNAFEHLASHNLRTGDRFLAATERMYQLIANLPEVGVTVSTSNPSLFGLRRVRVKGFKNYLIFYIPTETTIEIVRVLHGSRDTRSILEAE